LIGQVARFQWDKPAIRRPFVPVYLLAEPHARAHSDFSDSLS
jgi:hypothetical protein